jgi:hypothetical protein
MAFYRHVLLFFVALMQTTCANACAICAPPDAQNTLVACIASADAVALVAWRIGDALVAPVSSVRGALPGNPFAASGLPDSGLTKSVGQQTYLALFNAGAGTWRVVGSLAAERVNWLQTLLGMPRSADAGPELAQKRAAFFAAELENPVPWIAQAAYEELAGVPYAVLRTLGTVLNVKQVRQWSQSPLLRERWPLYALLWGFAAGEADARTLQVRVQDTALALNVAERSALLAALIELRKSDGLEWVQQTFLQSPTIPDEQLHSALLALSVHGNDGNLVSRDAVVQAYARFMAQNPQRAATVASDLGNWERWEFAGTYATLLRSGSPQPFSARYAMLLYLLRNPLPEAKTLLEALRRDGLL